MGLFDRYMDKVAQASATGGGNPIKDGKYLFMIEKIIPKTNHKDEFIYIAELRVLEAQSSGELEVLSNGKPDPNGRPVQPNAVGTTASFVCNFKHDSAAGNVKSFVLGALGGLGYIEDQITREVLAQTYDDKQPLTGIKVRCSTYRSVNRGRSNPANAGNILVLNRWESVPQTKAEVAKQRAQLTTGAVVVEEPAVAAPTIGKALDDLLG